MPHKLIAQNTFYQIAARLITSGVGLIVTLVIARIYGAFGYGNFTKITAVVGICYVFLDFGLNALFLQVEEQERHFWSLVYFRTLLALVLTLAVNAGLLLISFIPAVALAYPLSIKLGVLVYSVTILSQGFMLSASVLFQKKLRYDYLLYATVYGSLVSLFLVLTGFLLHFSLFYILCSLVIGSVFSAMVALYFTRGLKTVNISFVFGKKLFFQSMPIGLMLIANLIYFRIDTVLLSLFASTEQVGLYGYSYRFFDFLIALPLFLSNSLYPLLLDKKNTHNENQVRKSYWYIYGAIGIGIAGIAFILAPVIGFVKPEFFGAIVSFRILVLSLPLFFFTSYMQWILIVKKQMRFLLFVYAFFAAVNIFVNFLAIPRFGYLAPSVITDISEAGVFLMLAGKLYLQQTHHV